MAIGGLAVGVAALASLALWNTAGTASTTAEVNRVNQTSSQWTQLLLHFSDEYEALNDYLRADSELGREPLASSVGSADAALRTMAAQTSGTALTEIEVVTQGYKTYTITINDLLSAGHAGNQARVELLADQATLSASALRKASISKLTRIHDEQNVYLVSAQNHNRRLRLAEFILMALDAALLSLSAILLLAHQRRIERQVELSSHAALHDALTGIANRVLLQDRVQMAMFDAKRTAERSALLLLDLDRFKEVNDTLGHHNGDLLLCEVAVRLKAVLREGDTVARLGGDEFAILLRRVEFTSDVLVIAERALEALRRPINVQGATVMVGGSIGVALSPEHSADSGELLRQADIAMYEAKRRRTGVELFHPESVTWASPSAVAAAELAAAIEAGQMVLHYQPKLQLEGGRIIGVEALVRWRHPERGLLGPGEFVPVAEQSDLILTLTDHVLDRALHDHRNWTKGGPELSVAVNLGVRSLLVHDLPDRISAALTKHGTDPGDLILEITESAFITDISRAMNVLGRLRELGVRISIDDFGTGYSSMTYLQALPADELKIDRGFVGSLKGDRSEAIVRATLQLGHSLGLWVTAEGVEDEETLTQLRQIGCDVAQGYHICRPVPNDDLLNWFAATDWSIGRPALAVQGVPGQSASAAAKALADRPESPRKP
jgi:diguanylate cyclase (GGDEF)-like protein